MSCKMFKSKMKIITGCLYSSNPENVLPSTRVSLIVNCHENNPVLRWDEKEPLPKRRNKFFQ